jgi:hypothetical protein
MPRSLNEPVGIMNSSLKCVLAPCHARALSGVQPSPIVTACARSTSIAAA